MARNEDLNIRLNAQANLTNIDAIKKDLSKILDNVNIDKSVGRSFDKILNQMSGLEKAFENISKKDVFNAKDMETVAKKTKELQNLMSEVSATMKNIDITTLLKSTEQYKRLMENINKQTKDLKNNFKNATGLDFDKEIKNVDNLRASIEELKATRDQLQKTGVNDEYNRLLEEQNKKLDEQKQKLKSLKSLQTRVNNYREQEAKKGNYDSYSQLQNLANNKTTKVDFVTKGISDAEAKEVQRLTIEYDELADQLQRIEQYKNQASKTRGIHKLAAQLGIDAESIEDIDQAIRKMRELVEVTAKANINKNSNLKIQLREQYDAFNQARQAAKQYLAAVEQGANMKIAASSVTTAKTTSGLTGEIAGVNALLGTDADGNDSLLLQAEQNNTNAVNSLNNKIDKMTNTLNTTTNTAKAIVGLESQEKAFLQSGAESLKNIDDDTTTIIQDIGADGRKPISEATKGIIKKSEQDMQSLYGSRGAGYPENNDNYKTKDGYLSMLDADLESYMVDLHDNKGPNGELNFNIFSDIEKIGFEEDVANLQAHLKANIPFYEKQQEVLDAEIKTIQSNIAINKSTIKKEKERLTAISKLPEEQRSGSVISNSMRLIANAEQAIETDEFAIAEKQSELQQYLDMLNYASDLQQKYAPLLQNRVYKEEEIAEIIEHTTPLERAKMELQDATIKGDKEAQQALLNKIATLEKEQDALNNEELRQRIEAQHQFNLRVNNTIQTLAAQAQQLQRNSTFAKTFNDTFGQVTRTLGTYVSLNYIVNQVFSSIGKGINTIKEMDKSITQIGIVTGKTAQTVWNSFSTYNNQAKRLNTTTTQLLDATKLYYQQGLNTAEVNKMVEATAIAAALGEVEMAEAADTLTAIMNGYSMAATEAMNVTDKISAVGADSAADFGELSAAIEKVASSAATAGIDLDHLLGYLGKMVEVTREAPTNIGSAMKSIVSRMAELKEDPTTALEDGVDVNKVQTALKTVGIELFDTNNQMRDLDDVIDELGEKWDSLSRNSQAYIATIIAGNRQQSRFLALMNDYDRTMELVSSSVDSAGRSSEQFRNYNTGIEASLNKVQAELENLYVSFTKGNSAIKGVYDLFADFLGIINTLGPALTSLGLGTTAFFAKFASNAQKLKKEKAFEDISRLIATQIESDTQGKTTAFTSEVFGGTSMGSLAEGIFNKANNKQLAELNTLIGLYNQGWTDVGNTAKTLVGVLPEQAEAIDKIAKNTGQGIVESTGIYIAQQKQALGTKALTASMWANVAAQAAMTLGITLVVAGVTKLISWLSDLNKSNREAADLMADTASAAQSEADALNTQLKKYDKLINKVDLTVEEKQELNAINNELMETHPDLIAGIDAEGNAYLKNAEYIKEYLKLKKLEAAQAKIDAAQAKLNSGRYSQGRAATGNGMFAGTNANVGEENTYGEESASAYQSLQASIKNYKAEGKTWGASNLGARAVGVTGSLLADVGTILTNAMTWVGNLPIIGGMNEPYAEVNNFKTLAREAELGGFVQSVLNGETEFGEYLYNYIEENYSDVANYEQSIDVLQKYEKYLKASMKEMEAQYAGIMDAQRDMALAELDLQDEQENIVSGLSKTMQKDTLSYMKDHYGTDVAGYEAWLQENQDQLSSGNTEILGKALTGRNGEEIQRAYENLNQLEKEGASYVEIQEAEQELMDKINSSTAITDEEKSNITQGLNFSAVKKIEDDHAIQKQALKGMGLSAQDFLQELGLDESYTNDFNVGIMSFLSEQDQAVREQMLESMQQLANTEGYSTEQGKAYLNTLRSLYDPETGNALFQQELNNLDFTDQLDVEAFRQKWGAEIIQKLKDSGVTDEEVARQIVNMMIPEPGTIRSEVDKKLQTSLKGMSSVNGININDLYSGQTSWEDAQEAGFDSGSGYYNNGNFLAATDEVTAALKENNKELEHNIELLNSNADQDVADGFDKIAKAQEEIARIEADRDNYANDSLYEKDIEAQEEIIKNAQKQIAQGGKQYNNAKRLNKELERQRDLQESLERNNEFADYVANVDSTIDSLKDYASIYEKVKNQELSQLDIIDLLANNMELIDMAYINEAGQIAINEQMLEELGQSRIDEAWTQGEAQIAKLEMQKAMIDGEKEYSKFELDMLATMSEQWGNLSNDEQQALIDTAKQLGYNLQSTDDWATFVKKDINGAIKAWQEYFKASKDEGGEQVGEGGSGGSVTVEGKETSDATVKGSEAIANIDEQIRKIRKYQDLLKSYKADGGKLYSDINNMGGGGDSGGKDEYEGMIEKLEHFYNYLRQIEALEAKINKLRERRNLIDATENYYIDDLMQENQLLKEQAALYGNYINDEVEYLAQLRNQLASAYGDWVYFNDEGVVQVKQTEFAINSEEEEERYNAFSELLEEYQNEYNTMLENQNTLYTIQATIIENINNSYDKVLKRVTDVAEQLEYINSISEHWVEMSFGSIEKLPLLNDQIKTTADMLLNAQKSVNELNGDFEQLNKTVQNSDFTSLLTWDEELGHYKVNNEAMVDPEVRKQFEAQGYNWAEVETWVNAIAAASQKITASTKETNTELMSAREQLKDLLEERISTISEIFEKATEEINKFYGIYEKKIEALGTENDLFGTKSENIDAQYDYLMTVAGHSKALLESLKKNNQDILNTLTTDYADYVQMIDGVAYINKMAIEESDTLTEAQKADLLQLYQLYYESQDQIEEVNEKFYDYISQIEELERAKRDAIIDLKNQLHDELIARDQEEIDELSEKYDKMSALDDEYYSQLQQRISDARNARSRLQEQQDLTQMQNRLSVLQRDNSGQYNSELVDLQRQINERLQAQADQNIDLEMERIAREQQQREEDRQMQITQMENLLTFKDENGIYWQETQDIINNGTASVLGILMSTKASEDQSNEARKQQLEDLQDQAEMANAGLSTQRGYLAADFRQALQDYVNTPLAELDIPGIALDNANTIANEIAHGTQVFINTMSGLFRLLNEANGKTEAGGYTTGLIDPETGVYTPPTKNPPKPPQPAPAPTTPSTNTSKAVTVGGRVKANSSAKIYNSSSGSAGGNQYYSKDPIYTVLKILGNRALVRHHKLKTGNTGWFNLSDLTAYKKGGYVNFTGPAWVDGTDARPEAFLNARQTALFETLRDALVRVPTMNSKETDNSENITIENLTIDVKQLADTDSVDKIVRTVKQSIYKDATSGNNMKINRR